jgi:phosphoribosylglycinamide formyltransferase-1
LVYSVRAMAKLRLGVLVSGNGSNLQAILDAIAGGELDARVELVLSNVAGARALERARAAGVRALALPHRQFPSREAFDARLREELERAGVEWVVLAGFMRLLTPGFLAAFRHRIVNIHPALLPSFPGTHALEQALAHGVKVTGCTVHLVDDGAVDAGPIIDQRVVPIEADDTLDTLEPRIHAAEHRLYVDVLRAIAEGRVRVLPGAAGERTRVRLVRA